MLAAMRHSPSRASASGARNLSSRLLWSDPATASDGLHAHPYPPLGLPRELFRADLVYEPPVGHDELPGVWGYAPTAPDQRPLTSRRAAGVSSVSVCITDSTEAPIGGICSSAFG